MYMTATGVTVEAQNRALLLHVAGPSIQKVFKGLADTGATYATAMAALDTHFAPLKNKRFERYVFSQTTQKEGETIPVAMKMKVKMFLQVVPIQKQ